MKSCSLCVSGWIQDLKETVRTMVTCCNRKSHEEVTHLPQVCSDNVRGHDVALRDWTGPDVA